MKKQFVNQLKVKDAVDDIFVISEVESPIAYRGKSGLWLPLKISDNTGVFAAKFWGDSTDGKDTQEVFKMVKKGTVVAIKGLVEEYQNALSVSIKPGNILVKKTGEYDTKDFVASTKRDIEQMKTEFKKIISEIQDSHIKKLFESFFSDAAFLDRFANSPAASTRHHSYVGGLLEHVLSLIDIAKNIVKIHPQLNLDLLVAGCIFHDIGKISEYQVTTTIEYTDEGNLLGHISIGYNMVADKIDKIDGFPQVLKTKILHMILSHHGELEWGSPVIPQFPEAIALHQIDNCDAKIKEAVDIKENATDEDWTRLRYGKRMYLK